jgi:hypothetical protein
MKIVGDNIPTRSDTYYANNKQRKDPPRHEFRELLQVQKRECHPLFHDIQQDSKESQIAYAKELEIRFDEFC